MTGVVTPEREPLFTRWREHDLRARSLSRSQKRALREQEIEFTEQVRSGEVRIRGAAIVEVRRRHECWGCGRTARVWFVSRWVPVAPGQDIGHVSYTDNYCAACMRRRMRPVEGP